ncbi:dihydrodipicolinate synthase family protein [Bradyrhizobium sp. Arg816]|uniref:dihydrodipicolinate synthase family protein n=1 Tax=Bradyrhizobium sp. Arg816 TaxID=2998491 RepID=UPI0027B9CFAC|nr:dihydrodipicolinate synthase family protein [Bradyrhizobium sp. Arg816]
MRQQPCAQPVLANQNGSIDESALESLLGRLIAADVDSIGLLGSTGSYVFFTREERRRAIEIATRKVEERAPLLVGIGALRTDEAVKLAQDARLAGATAGLLAAVSYTPLMDDEVFTHFETVARLGKLPLCITTTRARRIFGSRLGRSVGLAGSRASSPSRVRLRTKTA